jgi:hypothetical protein
MKKLKVILTTDEGESDMKSDFEYLKQRAKDLGVLLDKDDNAFGIGYWLLDPVTKNGIWDDDNFCISLNEVAWKLDRLEGQLEYKAE